MVSFGAWHAAPEKHNMNHMIMERWLVQAPFYAVIAKRACGYREAQFPISDRHISNMILTFPSARRPVGPLPSPDLPAVRRQEYRRSPGTATAPGKTPTPRPGHGDASE